MTALFERPSLTDRVIEHITQKIIDGEWSPGTVLPPEGALAQELGVSRTVIRECVRVLSSRGMLVVQQGRGTSVTDPSIWKATEPLALLVQADRASLFSWLEVRTILEVECAFLAAQRAGDEERHLLQEALEHVENAGDNAHLYCEADIHLHLSIARATRNIALMRLLQPLVQPLRERLQDVAALPQARKSATHEHRSIVECILEGDAPGARAAMEAHLRRVAGEIPLVLSDNSQREET